VLKFVCVYLMMLVIASCHLSEKKAGFYLFVLVQIKGQLDVGLV